MSRMSLLDNSQRIVDPFLLKVLETHRGQSGFTDILRSIQVEQNEIVDYSFSTNIIVQGCAGSGKTMILFHRLTNLLHNLDKMQKKITLSRVAIIIPNDGFREYIKDLAWSLGVDKIKTFTMDEYLLSKIDNAICKIFKDEVSDTVNSSGKERKESSHINLVNRIKLSLDNDSSDSREVIFSDDVASKLSSFIRDFEQNRKLMLIKRDEDRLKKSAIKKPQWDSEYNKWLKKSLDTIRDFREEKMEEFVALFLNGKLNREYLLGLLNEICRNGDLDDYKPDSDDLIMIDEGQDYGFFEYATIKSINPDCIINIYGDIDQKIFERGIDEWRCVQTLFNAKFFELNQDYRNSSQIVDYINTCFNKNIISVGFSTKDVEDVAIGKLPVYIEYEEKLLKHKVVVISEKPELYDDIFDTAKILTVEQVKGLEFDTVFISPEIAHKNDNYRYVAYTRALCHLYILND